MTILQNIPKLKNSLQERVYRDRDYSAAGATPEDFVPGTAIIKSITLVNDTGAEYSLTAQCKTMNIYENLMNPVVHADLTIEDSFDLIKTFPIIGEESVIVEFQTDEESNIVTYVFDVVSVEPKIVLDNMKMQRYILNCATPELLNSSSTTISKYYKGNISDLVYQILTDDMGVPVDIEIEQTVGIEEITLSDTEPLRMIDYLRRRAISKHKSSSYVFYRNAKGFHFITIEELIDRGRKENPLGDKVFYFDRNSKTSFNTVHFRNILAYNQPQFVNTLNKVAGGEVTNYSASVDMISFGVKDFEYRDVDNASEFKYIDDGALGTSTSATQKRFGNTVRMAKLFPVSKERTSPKTLEKSGFLQAYTSKMAQNITNIMIYGDSNITVGDVIKCYFVQATDLTITPEQAKLDAGNYLISKVRHMFILGGRNTHHMSCELIKGTFTE